MMVRRSLIAVCISMILLFAAGCGSGPDYEGKWSATDVENPAQIHMDPSLTGTSLDFELAAEGEGTVTLNGETLDISWSETDSGVKIEQGDTHSIELTEKDGKLTLTDSRGNTIYFEKQ